MADERQASMSIEQALDRVQESWNRLMVTMSSASEQAYSTRRDANGWTPLDHLAHVTAWERSRRFWLLGRPRHAGLGVTPEEFQLGYDPLNDIVRSQTTGQSYRQIVDSAELGHRQMLDAIQSYQAVERADSGGLTQLEADRLGDLLVENLADHYDEHREYIERILAG